MKALVLIVLLSLGLNASVARITFLKGEAWVKRVNKSIEIKTGFFLEKEDLINTKSNTTVQIVFNDETVITMGKNSSLFVKDYLFEEDDKEKNKLNVNFVQGVFKTISGKIGKLNPKKFELRTKTSSIGIRGTQLYTKTDKNSDFIACTSGAIVVTSLLSKKSVDVLEGNFTKVSKNGAISVPKKYSAKEISGISNTSSDEEEKEEAEKKDEANTTATSKEENNKVQSVENTNNSNNSSDEVKTKVDVIINDGNSDDGNGNDDGNSDDGNGNDDGNSDGGNGNDDGNSDDGNGNDDGNSDDDAVKINYGDYLEYGYKLDNNGKKVDVYIKGNKTPTANIKELSTNNVSASYEGNVLAMVSPLSGGKITSSGKSSFDIDFGKKTLTGEFEIYEEDWKFKMNKTNILGNGFASKNIEDNGSNAENLTGYIKGSFYGKSADSIGGSLNIYSTNKGGVQAVFGAEKKD